MPPRKKAKVRRKATPKPAPEAGPKKPDPSAPSGLEREVGRERAKLILETVGGPSSGNGQPAAPGDPSLPPEVAERAKLTNEGFGCYVSAATRMMGEGETKDPIAAELVQGIGCFAKACLLKYATELGPYMEEAGLAGGIVLLAWRKKQLEPKKPEKPKPAAPAPAPA